MMISAVISLIGVFSGTISISSEMTQCRIILILQPITKLYLFTIELNLRDDFRCFHSQMCFRTLNTVPLNSPMTLEHSIDNLCSRVWYRELYCTCHSVSSRSRPTDMQPNVGLFCGNVQFIRANCVLIQHHQQRAQSGLEKSNF